MPTPLSWLVEDPAPYFPGRPLGKFGSLVFLTTPLTWALIPLAPAAPPTPALPTASPVLPCPVSALSQQDLLDLISRNFTEDYLFPLQDPGPGYEIYQAFAAIGARLSTSVANLGCDAFITSSAGGSFATGVVELVRQSQLEDGSPVPGQTGAAASIVSGAAAGNMRVTGLTGMMSSSVGHYLVLSNTASLANTGVFQIVQFNNPNSVDVANSSAVVPDVNNGVIEWAEEIFIVTVKAGTVVTTSRGGKDFFTTADVTFQKNDFGPFSVPVVAVEPGYDWNVEGTVIAADGTPLPGEIDTIKILVEDPPLGDITIQVSQPLATSGGRDASLDQHGIDRNIIRSPGEADGPYMARVRSLPDTLTPDAIDRHCKAILDPVGATFEVIETWDINYQTCFDAPELPIPGSDFDPTLFVFDDPRPPIPFRNRLLDENDHRGAFIVVVSDIPTIEDVGFALDDPGLVPTDFKTPVGARAPGAYDVPLNQGGGVLQCALDGPDLPRQAVYKGLYDMLQSIKAAGVSAVVELLGQ